MSAANTVQVDGAQSNPPWEAANKGETDLQVGRGECGSSMDLCCNAGFDDESALDDQQPLDDGDASTMVTPEYAVRTLAPEHDPRQHVPMYPAYMAGATLFPTDAQCRRRPRS